MTRRKDVLINRVPSDEIGLHIQVELASHVILTDIK